MPGQVCQARFARVPRWKKKKEKKQGGRGSRRRTGTRIGADERWRVCVIFPFFPSAPAPIPCLFLLVRFSCPLWVSWMLVSISILGGRVAGFAFALACDMIGSGQEPSGLVLRLLADVLVSCRNPRACAFAGSKSLLALFAHTNLRRTK